MMDYVSVLKLENEVLEKYSKHIPSKLLEIWENDGLGVFINGYLKTINPDDYKELLDNSYFRASDAIPIMVTAFGDVITWEKNEFVGIVKYKHGTSEIMISNFNLFIELLNDSTFVNKFFQVELYNEAIDKYGLLNYDECFGYVPLLAIGGEESVNNLKKVKIREHIALIVSLVGGV